MKLVHSGDDNIRRAKVECLRGKHDDMRKKEGDFYTICKFNKGCCDAIKGLGGTIMDSKIISKVLRTLLPIYSIKFSTIQEVRAMPRNDLKLDGLVGWLTKFELRNYDNSVVIMGNAFNSSLTINSSKKKKNNKEESKSKIEDDLDEIEVFLTRRLSRGKGKFPFIYFKSNEVDHFATKYSNRGKSDRN